MIRSLFIAVCAVLVAGCSSDLPDGVRSVLGPRQAPRSRVYACDGRAAYEAARAAAESMGFRYVRGGPATGRLEALSEITPSEEPNPASSRQVSMKVTIDQSGDLESVVSVAFTEIIEDRSASSSAIATETPLKDTPMYEVFFRSLDRALHPASAH